MGKEARRIEGVRAVENLLHVAGTRAPAGRSKLERQRAGSDPALLIVAANGSV